MHDTRLTVISLGVSAVSEIPVLLLTVIVVYVADSISKSDAPVQQSNLPYRTLFERTLIHFNVRSNKVRQGS